MSEGWGVEGVELGSGGSNFPPHSVPHFVT